MSAPDVTAAINAQKTDLTTSYMNTNGGLLEPADAREFIENVIADANLLKDCKIQVMTRQKENIDRIGFSGNVVHADVEGTASDAADRATIVTSRSQLDAQDFKAVVHLNYKVQRENIEGQSLATRVRNMLASEVAIETENIALNGDTEGLTSPLNLLDGLVVQSTANVVSGSEGVSDWVFYNLRDALPSKYWRDLTNMRYYCSPRVEAAYQMYLRTYPQALGQWAITADGKNAMSVFGVPIKSLESMPDTTVILTNRNNIVAGFFVEMYLEQQRFIDEGIDKYVLRYSFDVKYAMPAALAVHTGVNVGVISSL